MTNKINNQPKVKRGFAARMDYYRKLALSIQPIPAEQLEAHKISLFIRADVRRSIRFSNR